MQVMVFLRILLFVGALFAYVPWLEANIALLLCSKLFHKVHWYATIRLFLCLGFCLPSVLLPGHQPAFLMDILHRLQAASAQANTAFSKIPLGDTKKLHSLLQKKIAQFIE